MDNQNDQIDETQLEASNTPEAELEMLKQRADIMGLKYSPKIGVDALRKKVEDAINGVQEEKTEEVTAAPAQSKIQREAALRKELQMKALRLVRLRITNLNPTKKDLAGEIFTVANKYIGNVRKFIPYGEVTENGYHVPFVIYEQMKARKFLNIKTRRDARGQIVVEQNWAPEFALEVLEPLTQEELNKLAAAQHAAGGL